MTTRSEQSLENNPMKQLVGMKYNRVNGFDTESNLLNKELEKAKESKIGLLQRVLI